MWVVVLGSKGNAANAIRCAQAAAEAKCGHKMRVLRTDNSGEFTVAEFASYCADEGVQCHYSMSYNPQQNGVVERCNQTVVGMARTLLKQEGNVGCLLGRGSGDGCLHAQPLVHQGSQRQDAVQSLTWVQVGGLSPMGLRLPRVRQGAWPHR
jgi:transposase InsO family protein